jgi:uncharacterized membrane protein YhaH (DUF805 family)
LLRAIKYNLRHLLDFSGRDARQTFWFYVLFLFIVYFALGMVGSVALMGNLMDPMMEAANSGASEQEMQAQLADLMGTFMGRMVGIMLWVSVAVNAIMDLLLAAAFVRRLHDSNSWGWWAVAVPAAQVVSTLAMIPMMEAMQSFMSEAMDPANMGNPAHMQSIIESQSQVGLYGLIGWVAPILVIVFGVMPSTDGPNRYGAEPVRF